ncbi:hypothetical protein D9M68_874030 [compost metagenome]
MRASPNMAMTAALELAQSLTARPTSSSSSTRRSFGAGSAAISTAAVSTTTCATVCPLGRSRPLLVSIHTSRMPLSRMRCRSVALFNRKCGFQNGCSIHEPHSSWIYMPSSSSVTGMRLSTTVHDGNQWTHSA